MARPGTTPIVLDLGFRLRAWQEDFVRRRRRFNVLVCHRRSGKTALAILMLIDAALRCVHPRGRFAYVCPELGMAKRNAWEFLRSHANRVPGCVISESDLAATFRNGASVSLRGADNPDSLRGSYLDGCALDETQLVKPVVFGEILRPMLADRAGWLLALGTPKGVGTLLSDLYFKGETKPDWRCALYPVDVTDALPPDEIESMRDSMTSTQWRQEMLLDWSASSDDSLIPLDLVDQALGRRIPEDAYTWAGIVLGVDVARFGSDRTVIQPMQGLKAHPPTILRGAETMEVVQRIIWEYQARGAVAIHVDGSGGHGAGVIDVLRSLNFPAREVNFGSRATDPRFLNVRSEIWHHLKDWLGSGSLPDVPEYRTDLTAVRYEYNTSNKLALEPKDRLKARGLPSPDLGDALALCLAHDVPMASVVRPRRPGDRPGNVHATRHEYDPLSYDEDRAASQERRDDRPSFMRPTIFE